MEHHEALKDKIDTKALERLVQIESHGSLDGLGNLPTLTIEEAIRATEGYYEIHKRAGTTPFQGYAKMLIGFS